MISALLHLLLVLLFGGSVLFNKYIEPPDFDAGGSDFLTAGDVSAPPQQEMQQTLPTPTIPTPTVTAPQTTLTALTTVNPAATSFVAPVTPTIAPTLSNNLTEKMAQAAANPAASSGKNVSLPGTMGGRGSGRRSSVMAEHGGKMTSEAAVVNALRWLQKVQNSDGTWAQRHRGAMTGLALLCYLGHGETPAESREFGIVVNNAITALVAEGTKSQGRLSYSDFNQIHAVYQHAIATYALCEAYTMTKDEKIAPVIKQAIDMILQGQSPDGGWVYNFTKATPSDTSVSGWQFQALKAAHLTGLQNDAIAPAMEKAVKNFERVFNPKNGTFGYKEPNDRGNGSLTGVGILCKLFWQGKADKMVRDGLKNIETHDVKYGNADANLYTWYYNTQACFQAQGGAWDRWNRAFQDEIVTHQSPDGSWPATGGKEIGEMNQDNIDSQVYRTTLCALMLEVYYRYLPTGRAESAGPGSPSGL